MTRSVSESSLVSSSIPSIPIESSQIVIHDEDENSNVLDVEEYCSNREVVNLENAAVNIDNSNDVIIGPVTQFNVNGNVTIYSNGNAPAEAINGTTTLNEEQQPDLHLANGAKLGKCEKTDSEEHDIKSLDTHKKVIKILISISFALLVAIGVTVLILHYTNSKLSNTEDENGNGGGSNDDNNLGEHQLLDRNDWNGRPPISYINNTPPIEMVIIKHTAGGFCKTFTLCAGKVQTIQSQCVSDGLPDIRYNFLIGGDGNIYVGRGWDVQPAERNDTIDIAYIGSYAFDKLTPGMIEAAKLLLEDGVSKKKLSEDYIIVAHNQTRPTESPGTNVFKEIITWPHYDGGMYFVTSLANKGNTTKKRY